MLGWIARAASTTLVVFELGMCAACVALGMWLWPGIPNLILLLISVSMAIDAWTVERDG